MKSPDQNAHGLLTGEPDFARYESASDSPDDVAGKISKHIRAEWTVLDIGCGTGSVTEQIRRKSGCTIKAVEPDKRRFEVARLRGIEVYWGYLDSALPDPSEKFDCVVLADVVEHTSNPAQLLLDAKEKLKSRGSVVISVPNVAHFTVRIDLLRGNFRYRDCGILDATHLRWFTSESIISLLRECNLKVTAIDFTVNSNLWDYQCRTPWKWIPPTIRSEILRRLVSILPNLFGVQIVVKAELQP